MRHPLLDTVESLRQIPSSHLEDLADALVAESDIECRIRITDTGRQAARAEALALIAHEMLRRR